MDGQGMDGQDWGAVARIIMILVLVTAAVMSRRLPLKDVLRYALIWAAIIAALLVLWSLAQRIGEGLEDRQDTGPSREGLTRVRFNRTDGTIHGAPTTIDYNVARREDRNPHDQAFERPLAARSE